MLPVRRANDRLEIVVLGLGGWLQFADDIISSAWAREVCVCGTWPCVCTALVIVPHERAHSCKRVWSLSPHGERVV